MVEAVKEKAEEKEQTGQAAVQENHEKHGPHPFNYSALQRLQNIEGQVRGLLRMVEEQKYCVDILIQISAARAALKSVGMLILKRHIETCVSDSIRADETERARIIGELMSVLSREEI